MSLGTLPHPPWSNANHLPSFTHSRQAPPLHPSHPLLNPMKDSPITPRPPPFTKNGIGTTRARSATVAKGKKGILRKKGILGFVLNLLGLNKRVGFSTPYDPIHLVHVRFNRSTGEFTGLPKEWKQLLRESGVLRPKREENPKIVMEIVKFHQGGEGGGDVRDKMGSALKGGPPVLLVPPASEPLMNESFYGCVCRSNFLISAFG